VTTLPFPQRILREMIRPEVMVAFGSFSDFQLIRVRRRGEIVDLAWTAWRQDSSESGRWPMRLRRLDNSHLLA